MKKIPWWWPVGIAVVVLLLIAVASSIFGGNDAASLMFGFAGLIVAIATSVAVMSALKLPLSNFLEETIGEKPAKVGTIFAYLIVYFAGLKVGGSVLQQAAGALQEEWIHAFSTVISAPADVLEIIIDTTMAPWLIFLGILMMVGYLIYQRIRIHHQDDSTNVGSESEEQEES